MIALRIPSLYRLHAECRRLFYAERLNLNSAIFGETRAPICHRSGKSSVESRPGDLNRNFHSSCRLLKEDRRQMILSAPVKQEGVEGERSVDIDTTSRLSMFPDENTPNRLFNGVRFSDLPICHVKSSPNNTIMNVTTHKGEPVLIRSCGMEGFKNAKKGTNIAAQATGISLGMKILEQGITTVRIKVQGLGPGRMASVKGLQMAGVDIVSITDDTPLERGCRRPRKQRRL